MSRENAIVILDGGRRIRAPTSWSTTSGRGSSRDSRPRSSAAWRVARGAPEHARGQGLIGHVVMGMASHSHRDSIYRGAGMPLARRSAHDVPA